MQRDNKAKRGFQKSEITSGSPRRPSLFNFQGLADKPEWGMEAVMTARMSRILPEISGEINYA